MRDKVKPSESLETSSCLTVAIEASNITTDKEGKLPIQIEKKAYAILSLEMRQFKNVKFH